MAPKFRVPSKGIPFKPHKTQQTLVREGLSGAGPGVRPPKMSGGEKLSTGIDNASGFLGNWRDALVTGVSMLGMGGATIAGAAGLGQLARPHLEKLPKSSSGRGAGRTSFRDSNNQNRDNPNALGDQTSTARPQASGTLITIDGKTYDTGYHSKEIAELRKKNAGGGNAAQSANGRGISKPKNPNGVESTGTATSPITPMGRMEGANEALRKLGVTTVGYGKFQSNNLPGSTYSPEVREALSKIYDSETLHRFDSDANNVMLSEDLFIDRSGVKGEGSFYADDINYDDTNYIDMTYGKGSPFLVRNGDSPITSIVESQNKLGTRARYDEEFLNSGDTSMAGLKAAEASKGLLYASGGYYRENPKYGQEGEKDYLKIEEDEFKAIKNSDMNAQDFFASKLAEIKGE